MKSFLQQIEEAFEAVDQTNDIIDDLANHVNHLPDEDMELEEISTSAGAGSYMTPNAFAKADDDTVQSGGMKRVKNVREAVSTPPTYRPGEYQKPESEEEEYNEKFPFAIDDAKWYNRPMKYPSIDLTDTPSQAKKANQPPIKPVRPLADILGETVDSKYEQLIESYRNFKKGDDKPSSKVKRTIQEIAMKLREIETLVSYNSRLKTESGVTSSHYGPSTNKALNKISERLIKISERVRALGE
jgi:hypothetical protein